MTHVDDNRGVSACNATPRLGRARVDRGAQGLAEDYRRTVAEHRAVAAQQCDACATYYFPPLLSCSRCHSEELSWVDVGSTGTVATFVTVHAGTVTPSMGIPKWLLNRVPYTSVYVTPDSVTSIRIPALMEGSDQEALEVGTRVLFDLSDPRTLSVHLST